MKRVAWWISFIFGPLFLIPILAYLLITNLVARENWLWVGVWLGLIEFVLPNIYLRWEMVNGKVGDVDVTKRQQRYLLFGGFVLIQLMAYLGVYFMGEFSLAEMLFRFWILMLLIFLITFFWKISVHAILITSVWILLGRYWGWGNLGWLGIFIPVVMWSRLILKKHTWGQGIAGALLAIAILGLG